MADGITPASSEELLSELEDFFASGEESEEKPSWKELELTVRTAVNSEYFDDNCLITLVEHSVYLDVRFILLREMLKRLQNTENPMPISFLDLLNFLEHLEMHNDVDRETNNGEDTDETAQQKYFSCHPESLHHPMKQKKAHSNLYEKIVLILAENAPPGKHRKKFLMKTPLFLESMHRPFLLGDYFVKTVKENQVESVFALHGLIALMQTHNFECPNFYHDVYALIRAENFSDKKTCDYFSKALDLALSSAHVSQCTVASYLKRLARIALFATPEVAVVILSLIHNALVRNEACRVLIDKKASAALLENCQADPFNIETTDPLSSNAINSSLWELVPLQRHWHPQVAKSAVRFSSRLILIEDSISQVCDDASKLSFRQAHRWAPDTTKLKTSTVRLNLEPPADNKFFLSPFCRS